MSLTEARALCVSLHDVAPATWKECDYLLQAIRDVAAIPVTLLVVPDYHRLPLPRAQAAHYEQALERRLANGDELVLHGYSHLDEAARAVGWRERFIRHVYTRGEGEFYAIDKEEAGRRLRQGLDWFDRRGWPVEGFVAPAWLMGEGAWAALAEFPFSYTTTLREMVLLPERERIASQSLVYSVGSAWRRAMSCSWNKLLRHALSGKPVVRLSLHPVDVRHPGIVRHFQNLLAELLQGRTAMTKADFVRARRAARGSLSAGSSTI